MANLHYDFIGRSVIITGGARGIGRELGREFSAAGASTYLIDLDETALDEAATETGASTIVADVSNTKSVEDFITQVITETQRIDIIINNAGVLRDRVLWKLEDNDWETVIGTHLGGTFRCTRACVPHFRSAGTGRVINVTSYTGMHGNFGQTAYAAAKAGIIGFTKSAAKELAQMNITVNAISPNAETRMVQSMPPEVYERSRALIPAGRFGAPSEMTAACAFLASDEAQYITGVVLPVDGGLSM